VLLHIYSCPSLLELGRQRQIRSMRWRGAPVAPIWCYRVSTDNSSDHPHINVTFIHKTSSQLLLGIQSALLFHYRVARYMIIYSLLHTDRYAGYQMLAYIRSCSPLYRRYTPDKVGFRTQEEPLRLVHSRKHNPIIVYQASRVRDSETPCRGRPRLCGVGVRGLARGARIFGYVSSRRRWSLASISSNCEENIDFMR